MNAYVQINEHGTVTIPDEARGDMEPGALYEVVRRDDGVIELRPKVAVDASQAWFWADRWQAMEQEADADYAAGRYKTFDDVEGFLDDLDASVTERSPS